MKPRVSIVTSVYNGEHYFDRVVPGILTQTFEDFEWVIVDDGSTDRTPELLALLASEDERVKVFTVPRYGRVKAFNYAISKAQGEYIANQDFDDSSYPSRLVLQSKILDSDPKVGLVGCDYTVNEENRNQRFIRSAPEKHEDIIAMMAQCVPFANTLVMYRKEAWIQTGGYIDMDGVEDLEFWIRVAEKGWRFSSVPQSLGEHWIHSTSFWHQSFSYSRRQKTLASMQRKAVVDLHLPKWMFIYPVARYLYCYFPKELKTFLRRTVIGVKEKDV
jgi:glycosyltransferase EpsE